MLYGLVIAVHVIACLILIGVILLQAGRGGGLSETFGGESTQTIFGTKTSVFLARATIVAACLFLITCLFLGILTSRRGRSLIDLQKKRAFPVTIPYQQPAEESKVKIPDTESGKGLPDAKDIPRAEPEKLPQE